MILHTESDAAYLVQPEAHTAGENAPSTLVHILPLSRFSTESWKNDRAQSSNFYI